MPFRVNQLYYIAPIENIRSIIEKGVLSHDAAQQVGHFTIYDKDVLAHRLSKLVGERSLSSYANLFFQPSNSMLFSLLKKFNPDDIIVVGVSPSILDHPAAMVTNGNAATSNTLFFPSSIRRKALKECEEALLVPSWSPEEKSRRMAECLYPDLVPPDQIRRLYVRSRESKQKVVHELDGTNFPEDNIVIEEEMFFESSRNRVLGAHLSVKSGDMFLSRMQTLTISVNCVGAMGRGQASTARHYFPDLHTKYRQLCIDGQLKLGKPYLYKQPTSRGLFDDYLTSEDEGWFLLFPTKNHFKDPASLEGIREGLNWVRDNYHCEGIKSLAVPALGCGLGWLKWRDVWPVIKDSLMGVNIPVEVYLPSQPFISDSEIL